MIKTSAKRRERERNELRLRILECARLLFNRGGEEAVTLRGVAEAIEYSPTAIYAHYPSKEALVQAVCEAEFSAFNRSLKQANHLPDPMERLRKMALSYVDFGLQHPEQYRVLFMREPSGDAASHKSPAKLARDDAANLRGAEPEIKANEATESPYEYLQKAVFKAMAAGCFKSEYRDVALLAQTMWSILHGLVALHLVRARQLQIQWKPIQHIVEMSLECCLNGLTVPSYATPPTWRRP